MNSTASKDRASTDVRPQRPSAPPADIIVTADLVRALLHEQHPDLAPLALRPAAQGWDNYMFRLGDDLAVRLPRRRSTAPFIEHEQRWLPELAPTLPLPIPAPVRVGRAGQAFQWPWSIVPWLPGANAVETQPSGWSAAAGQIGEFLRALHQPAPADAPRSAFRSIPLADRTPRLLEHLDAVGDRVDHARVVAVWERVLAAGPFAGPRTWLHGDLHPGNIVLNGGVISGVVDFSDLTAGDPATDLSLLWMWFPAAERARARQAIDGDPARYDEATWMRARGWALAIGIAVMALGGDDDYMVPVAERAVTGALNDPWQS
jgi:aminoglycoside phosphotransferase (APT) family kinase protein